jgi:excisionase family DNA binding protein
MAMPIQIRGETYLNTSEAMGRLGVSRPTFDNLVKAGQLTKYRQGVRQVAYYRQSDVDALLEMREANDEEDQ